MMEEIDRFQVPPVNGETQPLVRERKKYTNNSSEYEQQHFYYYYFFLVSFVRFIATAVSHNLRVRAERSQSTASLAQTGALGWV